MADPVFPTIPGLGWSVIKSPKFATRTQKAVSGRQFRISDQVYPIWTFTVLFNYLRDKWDTRATGKGRGGGYDELRTLAGAFLTAYGAAGTFLFNDPSDNTVTGAAIGTGTGTLTTFQLKRSFGGFIEPITAPHTVSHVYTNGVDSGGWSVSADTGIVTYGVAPAGAAAITADFTYYFRCHFTDDTEDFENFMYQLWQVKQMKFESVLP